jgi:hypothetical protein
MRAALAAHFGEVTGAVHPAQIFAAVGFDDHRRMERRWSLANPRKEIFSVAAERDFDEMRHYGAPTR